MHKNYQIDNTIYNDQNINSAIEAFLDVTEITYSQ